MTPFSVVEGPEAWKAADYQDTSKFMYVFNDADVAELDGAIAAVQERGLDIKVGAAEQTSERRILAALCICHVGCQEFPCRAFIKLAGMSGDCMGCSVWRNLIRVPAISLMLHVSTCGLTCGIYECRE